MTSDWLFWLAGGLLGIAGLWLAYWALLSDRAKGRKRCPKCWYDMQGAEGLRCPECGHTAKGQRKLLKTRRRWRWALLSVLLLVGSFSLEAVPKFQGSYWRLDSSTTLLVLLAYFIDDQDSFWYVQIRSGSFRGYGIIRYAAEEELLTDWQWRLMMSYVLRELEEFPTGGANPQIFDYLSGGPPYAGLAIEKLSLSLAESTDAEACNAIAKIHSSVWASSLSPKEREDWAETLIDTLARVGTKSKETMVQALGECGPEAVIAVPHLLALLEEDDADLRVAATEEIASLAIVPTSWEWVDCVSVYEMQLQIIRLLAKVGTSREKISEAMMVLLESDESEEVQLAAALSLCQLGEGNPRAHQVILDHVMRWPSEPLTTIFNRLVFFPAESQFLLPGLEFILSNPQEYPESSYEWAGQIKRNILENASP